MIKSVADNKDRHGDVLHTNVIRSSHRPPSTLIFYYFFPIFSSETLEGKAWPQKKKSVGKQSPLPFFCCHFWEYVLISEIRVVYLIEICAWRLFKGKPACRASPALPAEPFFISFIVVFAAVCVRKLSGCDPKPGKFSLREVWFLPEVRGRMSGRFSILIDLQEIVLWKSSKSYLSSGNVCSA